MERVDVELILPHRFECVILDESRGRSGPDRPDHYFPGDQPAGQDGLIVRVQPHSTDGWTGVFGFGRFGGRVMTRVVSMPDPEKLCVVSKGAGYVVAAAEPQTWEPVRALPIVDVRSIPSAGLVVFADHTELVAYGEEGVRWRTTRLAWDGFKIVMVSDDALIGEYWDIRSEANETFEVNLRTGAVRGAVEG